MTAPPHRHEESEDIWATGQSERRLILKNIRAGTSNNRIDSQQHSIGSPGTSRSTTIRPLLYHGGFPSLPGVIYRGFRPGHSSCTKPMKKPVTACFKRRPRPAFSVISAWMAGDSDRLKWRSGERERGRNISYLVYLKVHRHIWLELSIILAPESTTLTPRHLPFFFFSLSCILQSRLVSPGLFLFLTCSCCQFSSIQMLFK